MMMVSNEIKTIPLTIHEPLKKVPSLISKNLILLTIKIAAEDLNSYFGIKKPKIIVTGLNPHAGENGEIGEKEQKRMDSFRESLESDDKYSKILNKNMEIVILNNS